MWITSVLHSSYTPPPPTAPAPPAAIRTYTLLCASFEPSIVTNQNHVRVNCRQTWNIISDAGHAGLHDPSRN